MDPKELRRIIDETLNLYVPKAIRRQSFRGACVQLLVTGAIETGLKFVENKNGGLGIFAMKKNTFERIWDTIYKRSDRKRAALFKTCHLPFYIGPDNSPFPYIPPADLLRTHLTLAICFAYERYMSVGISMPDLVRGKYNMGAIVDHYRTYWHPKAVERQLKYDMHKLAFYLKDEGVIDEDIFEDLDFNKESHKILSE